jgi:hypothetical protein
LVQCAESDNLRYELSPARWFTFKLRKLQRKRVH